MRGARRRRAAAQRVALSPTLDKASVGPRIGALICGLVSLADGIEEGPHNVTQWWVLGREMPAPSGRDKTSLLTSVADEELAGLLASFGDAGVKVLTIYERPSRKSLDTHRYLIEVVGHASESRLMRLLDRASCVRKAQGFELAAQCFAEGVRYWLHGDAE